MPPSEDSHLFVITSGSVLLYYLNTLGEFYHFGSDMIV
jgi:hypothetical protein